MVTLFIYLDECVFGIILKFLIEENKGQALVFKYFSLLVFPSSIVAQGLWRRNLCQ